MFRILPYSSRILENTDQKKLRIWTLFTQCNTNEIAFPKIQHSWVLTSVGMVFFFKIFIKFGVLNRY